MRRPLILSIVLLITWGALAYCEKIGSQFADDHYIEDVKTREKILGVANEYVKGQFKDIGYLAVKDVSTHVERRFSIVQVWEDGIIKKDDVYTVQIDSDEIGGEPRYILFLDLKDVNGDYKVLGLRIGPRHLRQIMG